MQHDAAEEAQHKAENRAEEQGCDRGKHDLLIPARPYPLAPRAHDEGDEVPAALVSQAKVSAFRGK
jgi:hypothetical protein